MEKDSTSRELRKLCKKVFGRMIKQRAQEFLSGLTAFSGKAIGKMIKEQAKVVIPIDGLAHQRGLASVN